MRTINSPETFRMNIIKKIDDKLKEISKNTNIKSSISSNIEKGLYNNCLEEATKKKLVKKWDNPSFVTLYLTKFKSIYFNITINIIEKITNKTIKPHNIGLYKI